MLIAQLILILAFVAIVAYFVSNPASHRISAGLKIFMVLFTLAAILAIVFPNSSNVVAHWFGVKYGVNLLVYLLTLAFIFLVLQLYIKERRNQAKIVSLTRKIALLESGSNKAKRHARK